MKNKEKAINKALTRASNDWTREKAKATFYDKINESSVDEALDLAIIEADIESPLSSKFDFYQLLIDKKLNKIVFKTLDLVTVNKIEWTKGYVTFAKTLYSKPIVNENSINEALEAMLDEFNLDDQKRSDAVNLFSEDMKNYLNQKKVLKVVLAGMGSVLFVVLILIVFALNAKQPPTTAVNTTEVTTEIATEQITTEAFDIREGAQIALNNSGWAPGSYTFIVDESKDASTTGVGAFDPNGSKTVPELIKFLESGSDSANAVLNDVIKDSKSTKEQVLNEANWIAIQSNVPFNYPGNTGFEEGMVISLGNRDGGKGDIFFMYVSPVNGTVKVTRGACANPQKDVPTPKPPTVTPPVLTPKSSNPADYKKPGDDTKKDSGVGTKPLVPTVTTPPEAKPPTVITVVPGGGSVVDAPILAPGSETGVDAPGAVPAPDVIVDKPVEPAIIIPTDSDPTNSDVIIGDPGNPFN